MDMKLVVFTEDGNRKDIPVKPGTYVVGRNEQASIRVPLPSVSRAHAELVVTQDGAKIRDLGSSNGTFQNHERVDQAELRPGDVLGIGDFLMTVQINGEPAHIERPTREGAEDERPGENAAGVRASDPSSESSMMDDEAVFGEEAEDSERAADASPEDSSDSGFDLSFLDEDDDNPQL